jgi:pilin isopeptide linkage protein/LPXTG-motif cell wall-anchored protein
MTPRLTLQDGAEITDRDGGPLDLPVTTDRFEIRQDGHVFGVHAPDDTTFTNTYKADGSVSFGGTKTLEGATLAEGQFSFQLVGSDNKVLQTKTNDASGNFEFDALAYDQDDAGKTFMYQIVEVNDGKAGYTYDSHACSVTVKVEDNGDGTLKCTATLSDGDKASFVNKYKEPDTPDTPDKPDKPSKSTSTSTTKHTTTTTSKGGSSTTPKTGDSAPTLLLMAVALAAGAVVLVAAKRLAPAIARSQRYRYGAHVKPTRRRRR